MSEVQWYQEQRYVQFHRSMFGQKDSGNIFVPDGLYVLFAPSILQDYSNKQYHSFQENLKGDCAVRAFLDIDSASDIADSCIITEFTNEFLKRHVMDEMDSKATDCLILTNRIAPSRKIHVHFPKLITTKQSVN